MGSVFIEFKCPYCNDWGVMTCGDDSQIDREKTIEIFREFLNDHIGKDHNEKNYLDTD